MLSRVANAIYWMNRYVERAENYARFMDVNFNLSLELPSEVKEQWKPLVVTTGDWNLYQSMYENTDKRTVIYFLGFDPLNPNSIYSCIIQARENARAIRPEITKEVWEHINSMYYLVIDGLEKKRWQKKDPRMFFTEIKMGCQLFYGILDATISRSDGWHFGNIGKLLERADKTSRILDVKYHILLPSFKEVGTPLDLIQWVALLKSVSAYDMYRKKYGKLSTNGIAEFLIFDKDFPRAIHRCVMIAEKSLKVISHSNSGKHSKVEKQLGLLKSQLEYSDVEDVSNIGMHEFLDDFQKKLNEIHTSIFDSYFSIDNIVNRS